MKIINTNHIRGCDLHLGSVLVVPRIEIGAADELSSIIIAGTRLETPKDPEGVEISILYIRDRRTWALQTEYRSLLQQPEYRTGTLSEIIKLFEVRANVNLPAIEVVDYGRGIYLATGGGEITNPWALIDGETYEVTNGAGNTFIYEAKIDKRGATLASLVPHVSADCPRLHEGYDPCVVFTKEMWQSLKHIEIDVNVTPAANEPACCKTPRM